MDAIVLVGGQGLRLRPLTEHRHKSLVPVCNRPAIEYLLDWMRGSGFERAILALGQHNDDLAQAYPSGTDYGGLRIELVHESARLESGGAIRNAVSESGIRERFAVLNGDVYVDFDFGSMVRAHEASRAELSMALHKVDDPSAFGVAVVDDEGMIRQFVEKPARGEAPSHAINAGVWIFERGLADEIPGAVRVEETLFPGLVQTRRRVRGFLIDGRWEDVGVPERYLALNLALLGAEGNCVERSARLAPGARCEQSVVGACSSLAARSTVQRSVLWESVTVGSGAHIEHSVIANDCAIGSGAVVRECVLGAGVTVAEGVEVRPGTSIAAGTRYDGKNER